MWGHVKEDGKGTGKVSRGSWSKVRLLAPGGRYRGRVRSEGDVQANAEMVYAASSAWREVASGGSGPADGRAVLVPTERPRGSREHLGSEPRYPGAASQLNGLACARVLTKVGGLLEGLTFPS